MIIALGETVLTMGAGFVVQPFEPERLLALAIAFTGTVAFWWCSFQRVEAMGLEVAEGEDDAGQLGWWGTWALTMGVRGLIAIAVGDELAIAHPGDDATLGCTLLTFGGPALFLLAQVVFLRGVVGRFQTSRLAGVAALAVLGLATTPPPLIAGIAAASAVLVAVAVADTIPFPSAAEAPIAAHGER